MEHSRTLLLQTYEFRHWWLILIMLAPWEAKIRNFTVQGQSGKIDLKNFPNTHSKMDWRYGSSTCFANVKA
jgi:hypothetical protein